MSLKQLETESFQELIKDKQNLFVIFDYDGTLTPIVPDPYAAKLSDEKKQALNSLVGGSNRNIKTAIVTGRALDNLKEMVGEGLSSDYLLIGTHGAEIGAEAATRPHGKELDEIKAAIEQEEHIEIEEKSLSIAIHYKEHPDPEVLIGKLFELSKKYFDIFRIQEGHSVFEFVPKGIDKGIAIDYLAKEYPEYFLMYFGDDLTDNYAFKKLNQKNGLSIQVGDRLQEREARFIVSGVDDVYKLIASLT